MSSKSVQLAFFFALSVAVTSPQAIAQDAELAEFYKGKTIQFIVGFSVGGGYDLYARAVAKHMGTHIPGNPTIVVRNMPGAGSRTAANWLNAVAPKDGTAMAMLGQDVPADQVLDPEKSNFDVSTFNWVGNPISDNNITFSSTASGLQTLQQVLEKGGLICGGTGASSTSVTYPRLLNNLLGANIRIVSGYGGGGDVNLAMERNELNCRGSNSWSSTKATLRDWVRDHKFNVLIEWGLRSDPEISEYQRQPVPLIFDFAKTEDDKAALTLLMASTDLGRPIALPPGVAPERVAIMRRAFNETMKDPAFAADLARQKMDLKPISGEELQAIATEVVRSLPRAVNRAKALISETGSEGNRPN